MIFTVEETTLAAAFDHSSRSAAVMDMMAKLGMIKDKELKEQVSNLVLNLVLDCSDDRPCAIFLFFLYYVEYIINGSFVIDHRVAYFKHSFLEFAYLKADNLAQVVVIQ